MPQWTMDDIHSPLFYFATSIGIIDYLVEQLHNAAIGTFRNLLCCSTRSQQYSAMMETTMRVFFCLAALCATTTTITTCNGFQHQSQSQLKLPQRQYQQSQSRSWNQPLPTKNFIIPPPTTSLPSQLNALPGLSSDPLGALAVLAGIVIVHESGHYLAARAFNISVEEFSIGFGPKILGFEKFGNEFNLRALPLGGYVRFPENYDSELLQENDQIKRDARSEIRQIEREQNIEKEWNLKEEVLNAVTLGYWNERKSDNERNQRLTERKERVEANKLELGSIPWWKRLFVKTASAASSASTNNANYSDDNNDIDKIYEVLDNAENFEVEYSDDPQLLQNRPWQERAVVLSGGVIFNLLLAFGIYFGEIGPLGGSGLPRAVFDDGVIVTQSPRSGGPSDGVLRKGDIITGINGQPLQIGSQRTSIAGGQKQVSDFISTIRDTPDGASITVQLLRAEAGITRGDPTIPTTASEIVTATTTSSKPVSTTKTISIQPQRSDGTTQTIGVMLSPNLEKIERLKSDNPIVAFKLAFEYLSDIFTQTLLGTVSVLASFISPSGSAPGQKISGPIGLIQQGSSVVATKDWTAVWLFAAGLSVNLGVINALPLPALDGGQLAFVIAEAISGKKIDQKFQEGLTSVAVLFLLWLSVSAAVGDVSGLVTGTK